MISKSTEYRIKNWDKIRDRERAWNRTYYHRVRNKTVELLGGECNKCGNKDIRVLQVDHVNGGGNSRTIINRAGQGRSKRILNQIEEGSKEYQLLCANCNLIKRIENKEIKNHLKANYYKQDLTLVSQNRRKTINHL